MSRKRSGPPTGPAPLQPPSVEEALGSPVRSLTRQGAEGHRKAEVAGEPSALAEALEVTAGPGPSASWRITADASEVKEFRST